MPAYNKITPAAAEELRACVSPGRFFCGGEADHHENLLAV